MRSKMAATVVLDNGASTLKVGFNTDSEPRFGLVFSHYGLTVFHLLSMLQSFGKKSLYFFYLSGGISVIGMLLFFLF